MKSYLHDGQNANQTLVMYVTKLFRVNLKLRKAKHLLCTKSFT